MKVWVKGGAAYWAICGIRIPLLGKKRTNMDVCYCHRANNLHLLMHVKLAQYSTPHADSSGVPIHTYLLAHCRPTAETSGFLSKHEVGTPEATNVAGLGEVLKTSWTAY